MKEGGKPVVDYRPKPEQYIEQGRCAVIFGVSNHPEGLRGDCVYTSPVVRIGEGGEFETENTIYRPVQ